MSKARQKGTRSAHFTGLIGEARFIEFAARNEWPIYRGLDGHEPYDYVVDADGGLLRVEVKGAWRTYSYPQHGNHGYYFTVTKIDTKKFDYLFLATPQGSYWIPSDQVGQTVSIGTDESVQREGKYGMYRVIGDCPDV